MSMTNGTLGNQTQRGKYEDNDIPGAKDPSEAYDLRYWNVPCSVGEPVSSPIRGIVTFFEWDANTAQERIEYGEPQVVVDGATVCVIIPVYQVMTIQGRKSYFEWYDQCCVFLGIEGDCVTLLRHVKDENVTQEERNPLRPRRICVTDWDRWAIDKLIELIKAGIGVAESQGMVKRIVGQLRTRRAETSFSLKLDELVSTILKEEREKPKIVPKPKAGIVSPESKE